MQETKRTVQEVYRTIQEINRTVQETKRTVQEASGVVARFGVYMIESELVSTRYTTSPTWFTWPETCVEFWTSSTILRYAK